MMACARRLLGVLVVGLLLPACAGGGAGTLTPTIAPGIPSDVQVFPGNHSVKIQWTSPAEGAQFNVLRALDAGGPYFAVSVSGQFMGPTTYVDSGLTNGTQYFYAVQATNSFGTSAPSSVASTTPGFHPVQVSASCQNSRYVALLPDGSVWSWGLYLWTSEFTSPVQVPTTVPLVAVSAGTDQYLALGTDGRVWAWGSNKSGQLGDGTADGTFVTTPQVVPGLANIVQISSGGSHNLALDIGGTVWAWGDNAGGQLAQPFTSPLVGTGPYTYSIGKTPIPVAGLPPVAMISAGVYYNLVVTQDGLVWAWGENGSGQLGNGTTSTTPTFTPALVPNLTKIAHVSSGETHSLALRSDGTVWGWGNNSVGQLGTSSTPTTSPVQASVPAQMVAVACGDSHSVALDIEGGVWTWGLNTSGQLGTGSTSSTGGPTKVAGLPKVKAIGASLSDSLALDLSGNVWTWGSNAFGDLGTGNGRQGLPSEVNNFTGAVSVVAGTQFSVVLRSDGSVWVWGTLAYGQLGTGSTTVSGSALPLQVPVSGIATLAQGLGSHVVGLQANGNVWAWGRNANGQVGNGATSAVAAPAQVFTQASSVAIGYAHTVAARSDGTLWTWGSDQYLQLGYGTAGTNTAAPTQVPGLAGVSAVAAGGNHTLALLKDGTVWTFGYNSFGQLGYPTALAYSGTPTQVPGLPTMVAIAGGEEISLALAADGTVWAWGFNDSGETGTGSTASPAPPAPVVGLSSVVAISAGRDFNLAIKSDGTVWGWGANSSEQLGNTTTFTLTTPAPVAPLPKMSFISAGYDFCLAVAPDGIVWASGDNQSEELGVPFVQQTNVPVMVSP